VQPTICTHWQLPGFPPRLEVLEAALYALHDTPARSSHYTGQAGAVAVQSFSTHLLSNTLRAILTHTLSKHPMCPAITMDW
jgi:hypothetical protein